MQVDNNQKKKVNDQVHIKKFAQKKIYQYTAKVAYNYQYLNE